VPATGLPAAAGSRSGRARLLTAAGTAAAGRSAVYVHGLRRGTAAPGQPGGLMPAGAIGLGLRQRPGDPQPRELGHPPLLHQALTVADDFAAGLPILVPTGLVRRASRRRR